jgi:hypothetical protein
MMIARRTTEKRDKKKQALGRTTDNNKIDESGGPADDAIDNNSYNNNVTGEAGRTCKKKVAHAHAHDRPTTAINTLPVATKIYRRLLELLSFLAHGPITRRCSLNVTHQFFPKVIIPYTLHCIRAYSNFLARVSFLSRGSGPDECNGMRYTTMLCRALPLLKCRFCCEGRAASIPCKHFVIYYRPTGGLRRVGCLVSS